MTTTERIPPTIDALVVLDLSGTIMHWSAAAEQLYGWTAREALGKRALDLIVPDGLKTAGAEIFARVADGDEWSGQFEFRHRDGSEVLVERVETPIKDQSGHVIAVVGRHHPMRIPHLAWYQTSLSADALTKSERNVVALVGDGLTDEEIATALG